MSEIVSQKIQEALYGAFDEQSILARVDERYAICEPLPRHMNSLFESLRETQRDLDHKLYPTFERATYEGDSLTQKLNKAMKSDKLLNKPVYLSGRSIHIPSIDIDPVMGKSATHADPDEVIDAEELLDMSEVAGYFKGVYYQLRPVDQDGQASDTTETSNGIDVAGYKLALVYQVKIGAYRHMHGKTDLYATGGVMDSTLEYDNDRSLRTIHDALEKLLSIESEKAAFYVNEINVLLANRELKFKVLKKVADLVRDLHASMPLTSVQSEALIDLIGAYIHPQGEYAMEAADAIRYETTTKGKEAKLLAGANGATLSYNQQISGIILAHGYERDPEDPQVARFDMKTREPYFMLESESGDQIIHVPMRHLMSFRLDD